MLTVRAVLDIDFCLANPHSAINQNILLLAYFSKMSDSN